MQNFPYDFEIDKKIIHFSRLRTSKSKCCCRDRSVCLAITWRGFSLSFHWIYGNKMV